MPYCSQCGNQVTDADQFCAKCGGRQPRAPKAPIGTPVGFNPRTASILCYIPMVGWIMSIVVLASSAYRNNRTVRFHAFQGLYLFVAWLIIDWVIRPLQFFPHPFGSLVFHSLQLTVMVLWIFMIVKTSQEQTYSLPVIGELAEKSLAD